jgi:cytidyltransferase-like protein
LGPNHPPAQAEYKHVVISGYFHVVHLGHVQYIKAAAGLGRLTVIVNNDTQLKNKRGRVVIHQSERLEIVRAITGVSRVVLSVDDDKSVCRTLRLVHEMDKVDVFGNGGDVEDCLESSLCASLGISCVYGLGGGKVNSSSAIVAAL